jgi:hypothetical protein
MTKDAAPTVTPLVVRLERDGAGSASFDWEQVSAALRHRLGELVADAIGGKAVRVAGMRFLDADGREIAGPAPFGIAIVGFDTRGM